LQANIQSEKEALITMVKSLEEALAESKLKKDNEEEENDTMDSFDGVLKQSSENER
jgi:hypothetical protein